MDNTHPPLAYSVKEACRISSLGKTRVYELIRSNELAATKIGRRTLVNAESLKRLITAR